MEEFYMDDRQRALLRKEKKQISLLKQKGWRTSKSRFESGDDVTVYFKHSKHGMTTIEGALEVEGIK